MPMRMTPAHIRSTLHLSLKEMENDIGSFVKRPGRDFSRRRIGTFSDTIRSIMTMEAHSLNRELFEFYCHLKKEPLTKSAFIQNRAKLNSSALPHLLKHFNSKIPFRKQYKGLHLIACDGTDSNIPADEEDTLSFIPFNSNNGGYYQFHTTVMFLYNLTSLIVSCAGSPNNNARFSCCISFSDAIYKCRSFLLGRISGAKLLVSLNRGITPVRPGRSFERKMRSQCLKSLQNKT